MKTLLMVRASELFATSSYVHSSLPLNPTGGNGSASFQMNSPCLATIPSGLENLPSFCLQCSLETWQQQESCLFRTLSLWVSILWQVRDLPKLQPSPLHPRYSPRIW